MDAAKWLLKRGPIALKLVESMPSWNSWKLIILWLCGPFCQVFMTDDCFNTWVTHQPLLRFLGKILPVLFDPTRSPVNLGRMRLFQSKFRFYDVDKVHQDRRFQRAVYVLLLIRRSGTRTFCLWSSTLSSLSLSIYI